MLVYHVYPSIHSPLSLRCMTEGYWRWQLAIVLRLPIITLIPAILDVRWCWFMLVCRKTISQVVLLLNSCFMFTSVNQWLMVKSWLSLSQITDVVSFTFVIILEVIAYINLLSLIASNQTHTQRRQQESTFKSTTIQQVETRTEDVTSITVLLRFLMTDRWDAFSGKCWEVGTIQVLFNYNYDLLFLIVMSNYIECNVHIR